MPTELVQLSVAALGCVFAWAAIAKLIGWRRWRSALSRYRLGGRIESAAAIGVPVAEALVVGLLLWGDVRAGASVAVALVALFSLVLLRARAAQGDRLPCGCFGGASTRDYRSMLARNALLATAAAIILSGGSSAISWTVPSGSDLLAALLTSIGLVLIAWIAWQTRASLRKRT
ncbi:MAG TPA: MauE/DoxX family redox-associated membrane protein [Actinomycetota bacterium]|jgi:hypothetical protein|nr:MauE/DoxX family redox-associated membrane protein [Actinomycetota bacterium]